MDIRNLANRICKASDLKELTDLLESKMGVDMAHPDIKDEKEHLCMDLSYIYELLSTGYDLPDNRQFKVMKKVKGFETGWCLGASIQMLDALASRGGI